MTKVPEFIDTCPICHKTGRLNPFYPTGSNKRQFYFAHEQLDYNWGTSIKASQQMVAVRKCYLTKAPHRQWALKRTGLKDDGDDEGFTQSTLG